MAEVEPLRWSEWFCPRTVRPEPPWLQHRLHLPKKALQQPGLPAQVVPVFCNCFATERGFQSPKRLSCTKLVLHINSSAKQCDKLFGEDVSWQTGRAGSATRESSGVERSCSQQMAQELELLQPLLSAARPCPQVCAFWHRKNEPEISTKILYGC